MDTFVHGKALDSSSLELLKVSIVPELGELVLCLSKFARISAECCQYSFFILLLSQLRHNSAFDRG